MAKTGDWGESNVPSEWTTSKDRQKLDQNCDLDDKGKESDDNPQAMRYRGWTSKGINRYNQLFYKIKAERQKQIYG